MLLLVSVASAAEAFAALEGGADIVDAKDPHAGALGAVSEDVLRKIHAAVGGARPVTAAIGDAKGEAEASIERTACEFAAAGALFVKVGFAGISSAARIAALIAATERGATRGSGGRAGVGIVAYAEADSGSDTGQTRVRHLVDLAGRGGARGVLLDTADKSGPGLRTLVGRRPLATWVAHAHEAGLLAALAGKLTADDLPVVRDAGADLAGVRGAACDGGRNGRVSADGVRQLLATLKGPRYTPATRSAARNASIRSASTTAASTPPGSARVK